MHPPLLLSTGSSLWPTSTPQPWQVGVVPASFLTQVSATDAVCATDEAAAAEAGADVGRGEVEGGLAKQAEGDGRRNATAVADAGAWLLTQLQSMAKALLRLY